MTRAKALQHRAAVLLAAVAVVAAVAAYTVVTGSANGRALEGAFCTTSTGSRICMTVTWDGVDYGTVNRTGRISRSGQGRTGSR